MGGWDNGTVCNIYYGGGWGSQSANATHHKFYAGSYASSGGANGSEVFKIDSRRVTDKNELYVSHNIVHIGDTTCKIRFPSNDNIQFETSGSPRLNITTGGCVYSNNFGIGTDDRWKIRPNISNADLAFEYSTSTSLADNNIKLPKIYSMGFPNANCIGCVKATSPTYWNLVRSKFPEVFNERAKQSRLIGSKLVRYKNKRIMLDELPAHAKGRSLKNYDFECGIFCEEKL